MSPRSGLLCAGLLVALVGCIAPSDGIPSSAPSASASPAVAPVTLPTAADLPFPPARRLPIRLPEIATPDSVVEAFLRLVRDPTLTYHADSIGRWEQGDLEILTASSVDQAGADRYLRYGSDSGPAAESIVRDGSAVSRQGTGAWLSEDAEQLRLVYSLSPTVVIGDLGPEGDSRGYRLVVDSGFDLFPRHMDFAGFVNEITEVVVDKNGRPMSLTFHRWSTPGIVGQVDLAEGYVVHNFSRVGESVTIPAFPIGTPAVRASARAPGPPTTIVVPGGGYTAVLPGTPSSENRKLTFYDPANKASGIDMTYLIVDSASGLHFEVGSSRLLASVLDGLSVREQLRGVRSATSGRISSGDVLGYRTVEMAGQVGEEVVADGIYTANRSGLFRIRNVFFDNHLIILSVGGSADAVGSAEADHFLSSLAPE